MEELEQEELNDRLMGADHVPIHQPAQKAAEREYYMLVKRISSADETTARQQVAEADEDAELRELQAALAM